MNPHFSICVYCGSRSGALPAYAEAAAQVGNWIGRHGGQLVYGGGRNGLMGVVAQACDKVVVLYAGRVAESNTVQDIFARPAHPYTRALMASMPALNTRSRRLAEIPGLVPAPHELGQGCAFAQRCEHAMPRCRAETPVLDNHAQQGVHLVACFAVDRASHTSQISHMPSTAAQPEAAP